LYPGRQGGVMHLAAGGAPARVAAMLLDQDRYLGYLDLLDDPHVVASGPQATAAVRADLWEVLVRGRGEEFRRGQGTFVLGVPGLPAGSAGILSRRGLRLGGRGDVRRRRVRGWWGGLAGGGQLRLGPGAGGAELGNGRRERLDTRLQPLAVDTRGSGFGPHAALFYAFSDKRHYPVNRYASRRPSCPPPPARSSGSSGPRRGPASRRTSWPSPGR